MFHVQNQIYLYYVCSNDRRRDSVLDGFGQFIFLEIKAQTICDSFLMCLFAGSKSK